MARQRQAEPQAETPSTQDPAAATPPTETIETAATVPADSRHCAECGGKLYLWDKGQRATCNNSSCSMYLVKLLVGD